MDINLYIHTVPATPDPRLDQVLALLQIVITKENTMSVEMDALTAQVNATRDGESAALLLIQGIAARITAAGTDPAALTALTTELSTSSASLAAAVVANTPVAPAPVVVPAVGTTP